MKSKTYRKRKSNSNRRSKSKSNRRSKSKSRGRKTTRNTKDKTLSHMETNRGFFDPLGIMGMTQAIKGVASFESEINPQVTEKLGESQQQPLYLGDKNTGLGPISNMGDASFSKYFIPSNQQSLSSMNKLPPELQLAILNNNMKEMGNHTGLGMLGSNPFLEFATKYQHEDDMHYVHNKELSMPSDIAAHMSSSNPNYSPPKNVSVISRMNY
jgi:hypothetical protein